MVVRQLWDDYSIPIFFVPVTTNQLIDLTVYSVSSLHSLVGTPRPVVLFLGVGVHDLSVFLGLGLLLARKFPGFFVDNESHGDTRDGNDSHSY